MEIYRVSFIGHRYIDNVIQIENLLREKIIKLLDEHEFTEFYVGKNGEFDDIVASVIKGIQRDFGKHNNCLILVLPYQVVNVEYYEKFYDEIIIPDLGNCHYKKAITFRNIWMVDNSDLLICYVEQGHNGGANFCFKYATRKNLPIINVFDFIE